MMGVAATVSGFGFFGAFGLAQAARNHRRCERPARFFRHRTFPPRFFRQPPFRFWLQPVFPRLRFFRRECPLSWRQRASRGGGGSSCLAGPAAPVSLAGSGKVVLRTRGGRRFGLRHAQIADGRLRHRLHIRAQAGTRDFLLQFFRLLFEFARAAFERGFIGGFRVRRRRVPFRSRRRIHSPSRKLVRNSRLMRHRAA